MIFRLFFLLALTIIGLSSCQDHPPGPDTFGELDSTKVATDTTMQVNMDRSYEYQKTLVENDTLVYDFTAYDKPKGSSSPEWESKFIVIRRSTHESDTIIKDTRSGMVQGLWLSDLDGNKKPEIIFYEYPKRGAKDQSAVSLYAYETDGRKAGHKLEAGLKTDAAHYRGLDSFFVSDGYLIRRYPYYSHISDSTASALLWQSYALNSGRLVFEKEKSIAQ